MAVTPQIPGQVITQPVSALLSKAPIFGSEFNEERSSVDSSKVFTNYFGRVHQKYKDMDTINIENLAKRMFQDQDPDFISFLRKETLLKDTFLNRFFEVKTPLGEVFQELESIQELPGRQLLPKKLLRQAEKEAGELIKKEVALVTEKGGRREGANEVSYLQKRAIPVGKIGPEFQINTYTTGFQGYSSVATLNNGNFVVTWQSDGQDGDDDGVYGQIFNADGTKSGSEFPVNTYTTDFQGGSSVATLNNGNFVVIWSSDWQDGDELGVYGQIFNADGTKNGSEFQVNTYTTDHQVGPSAASLSNGNFVVTWTSYGQDSSGSGVYGQIFNADGTKSGSEFQVNTFIGLNQGAPSVTSLSNGKFVVTWSGSGNGDLSGVYGQIFNTDGTKNGSEFQINTYITLIQMQPSVASLNNGKFVVTWQSGDILSSQDGSQFGTYGQILNADGTKSGPEFQVNTYTLYGQVEPSVTSFVNDKFGVTWTSYNDGSQNGVFGQIFNADGTKSGSEFQVNTYTSGSQWYSSLATLSNGNFVITWHGSPDQDGDNSGVYGQIFGTDITGISESSTTTLTSTTIKSATVTPSTGSTRSGTGSGLSTDSTELDTRATGPNTDRVSGAERQAGGVALSALGWIAQTIKGPLGY